MINSKAKQKIASTFLSLAPMEIAEVLQGLKEHEVLKVGEALLQYGNVRLNIANTIEEDGRRYEDLKEQAKHTIEQYNTLDSIEDQVSSQNSVKISKDVFTIPAQEEEQRSFLRIIANDYSSLEVIKALYRLAFGDKKAQVLISKLISVQLTEDFSFLHKYSHKEIYTVLQKEGYHIISFVMEVMDSEKSAKLLTLLSEKQQIEVIKHIATHKIPDIQTCQIIRDVLRTKLKKFDIQKQEGLATGGIDSLRDIISYLPFEQRQQIISDIKDTKLQKKLEERIINWDLLKQLPLNVLQELHRKMSNNELAMILYLKEHNSYEVMSMSVSKYRLGIIEEEINFLHSSKILREEAMKVKDRFFILAKKHLNLIDKGDIIF